MNFAGAILKGANALVNNFGQQLTLQDQLLALAAGHSLMQQREAARVREAHLRKFSYSVVGPVLSRPGPDPAAGGKLAPRMLPATYGPMYFDELLRDTEVLNWRREPIDAKRYNGVALRAIEQSHGCGKRHLPKQANWVRVTIPWSAQQRTFAFDAGTDSTGKPVLNRVEIYRGGTKGAKLRRDRRLESALTDEQWKSIYRILGKRMFQ